jgi:hypothetical protein
MKEGLERLLKENIKMIEEIREIPNGDYKPFHAAATHLYMSFQKYIQNREHYVNNWKKINKKIKRMLKRILKKIGIPGISFVSYHMY